jgi:hypothetical protein
MALGLGDFLGSADPTASALVLLLVAFLGVAARLLPLFLGTQGKGLLQLGGGGVPALFFEFRNTLVCCLELPL